MRFVTPPSPDAPKADKLRWTRCLYLRILQVGGKNRFYALTFRKPLLSQEGPAQMAAKAHAL